MNIRENTTTRLYWQCDLFSLLTVQVLLSKPRSSDIVHIHIYKFILIYFNSIAIVLIYTTIFAIVKLTPIPLSSVYNLANRIASNESRSRNSTYKC